MTISRANSVSLAAKVLPISGLHERPENLAADNMETARESDESLEGLFRDHYKGMFRVGYRITGSESDAEDVLQTVFTRLTNGWSERDLSPNPRAFVYRAAINASLDIVRQRKR